jgi:nitroreductase
LACLPFRPPGLINRQAAGGKGIFAGSCPALRLLFSTDGSALLRGILCKHQFHGLCPPLCASSIPRRGVAHHTVFLLSGKFYPLASLWYNKVARLNERDGTTMTNEVLNTMKTRRSCRCYLDKMPEPEALNAVLEAGTWAPTGMGRQSPVIVCIQNKADRDTLSKMNAAAMGGNGDPFYGAPCVAVVLVDKTIPTCVEDGSLVMGNMLNAAESVGLSACWIHRAKEMFETAEGQALLKKWGVPNAENLRGVGNCILGYAAEGGKKAPAPRKENYVVLVK